MPGEFNLQIPVTIPGAGQAADDLNRVGAAATNLGKSVNETTDQSTRAAAAQDKLGESSGVSARSMQHAQDASATISEVMNGQFGPALINATRGMEGFNAVLEANPILAVVLAVTTAMALFEKVSAGNADSIKASQKEIAENAENVAKEVKAAFEQKIDMASLILAADEATGALKRAADAAKELRAAREKLEDSKTAYALSQVDLREEMEMERLAGRGASQKDIAGARAKYSGQRADIEESATTRKAQDAFDSAQADSAAVKNQIDVQEKNLKDRQAKYNQTKTQLEAEINYPTQLGITQTARGDTMDDPKGSAAAMMAAQKNAAAATETLKKLNEENGKAVQDLTDKIDDLKGKLPALSTVVEATMIGLATAQGKNSLTGLKQSDQDDAVNRENKAFDLAHRSYSGAAIAAKNPANAQYSALIQAVEKAALQVKDKPDDAGVVALEKALNALGSAMFQHTKKADAGLLKLSKQVDLLSRQFSGSRDAHI